MADQFIGSLSLDYPSSVKFFSFNLELIRITKKVCYITFHNLTASELKLDNLVARDLILLGTTYLSLLHYLVLILYNGHSVNITEVH